VLVPHGADTRMALAAVLAVTAKIFRYEPTGLAQAGVGLEPAANPPGPQTAINSA
jgi:hypothetical protein